MKKEKLDIRDFLYSVFLTIHWNILNTEKIPQKVTGASQLFCKIIIHCVFYTDEIQAKISIKQVVKMLSYSPLPLLYSL